jgi:hypothetical protein
LYGQASRQHQDTHRIVFDIVEHAHFDAVLNWVQILRISLKDSIFADAGNEAVLCGNFKVFIASFGCSVGFFGA